MKKFFLSMAMGLFALTTFGQKQVMLKAGTIVPLQAVNSVKAADVSEGQSVDFRVTQDVLVEGAVAIPRGTLAKGKVVECRKSSVAGTKGRLTISISGLTLDNGESIYFSNTDVRIYGRNRTPIAIVAALFTFGWGILWPGSKAVMPANYEVQATVASNVAVTAK